MSRVDLYANVHKGVRAALSQTALLAGRTDFSSPAEAAEAARVALRLVALLDDHARHEDREVMPRLALIAPEVHADLQAEHARTEGLQRELADLAERLPSAPPAQRLSLGRRLHDALWRLAAEHLRHMDREETSAMRALWAHYTDEDLEAIHARIVASIPPDAMAEWAAILLPAVSLPERTAMLAPLAQKLPRPAFMSLLGPARAALGERWAETAAAVGL